MRLCLEDPIKFLDCIGCSILFDSDGALLVTHVRGITHRSRVKSLRHNTPSTETEASPRTLFENRSLLLDEVEKGLSKVSESSPT